MTPKPKTRTRTKRRRVTADKPTPEADVEECDHYMAPPKVIEFWKAHCAFPGGLIVVIGNRQLGVFSSLAKAEEWMSGVDDSFSLCPHVVDHPDFMCCDKSEVN